MNKAVLLLLYAFSALFFCHCHQSNRQANSKSQQLFSLIPDCGIDFTNYVKNTKDINIFNYRNFYNGGGTAIGDINNDGFADVFLTANMGPNKLFLNKGGFKFEDISEKAGFNNKMDWSTGVVMVDVNGDGWLDIYVCNSGLINGKAPKNQLYINNHNLTFTDAAATYGLANEGGYCTHAAFFDYDLDGDLDCYVLNNSFIPVNTLNYANKRGLRATDWPVADFLKGGGDKLLRNDNGFFHDVSEEANIYGSLIGFGLGVTIGDVNNDQYPDVYVSNDFFERDYLYINQKDGTFKEDLENRIQHISHSSMGADMGDLNNDGLPEIFVSEMLPGNEVRFKKTASFENVDIQNLKIEAGFYYQFMQNTLQVNSGNGHFFETAFYSGVAATDWSWGGLLFDADNDGLTDIFICNGIYNDLTDQDFIDFFANDVIQRMNVSGQKENVDAIIDKIPSEPIPNAAFRNIGNMRFQQVSNEWGLQEPSFSNGAAYGDLDNDGDLDLVVNNVNEPCFVYRNNSRQLNKNNFIGLHLKGYGNNSFAVGSTVKIYQNGKIINRQLIASHGYQSSVDNSCIIGLGKYGVDSMVIVWPDRSFNVLRQPEVNRYYTLEQSKTSTYPVEKDWEDQLLVEQKPFFDKHIEDDYNDFYAERNIPVMLSREGPKAAVSDVNGDGLKDIYIGGAAGQAGQLYLQIAEGKYQKKTQKIFDDFANFEDVAVLFFDCDHDGDEDLFLGSGGNSRPPGTSLLSFRLYKNDGKGNFTNYENAFSDTGMNTSVAIANDFDNDGDYDLFVGSRSVPGNYGADPQSFLFVNDGKGKFTDMAALKNQDLSNVGMVTGAVWADLTGNAQKELVIVGDWMAPKIFTFNKDHFVPVSSALDYLNGWWRSVAALDIDNDGDDDLVLGNIGENFYFKPDIANPVKLWLGNFDENEKVEKVMTRTAENKDVPVFLKRDLTDQIPALKKQNLKHADYAHKSIRDLFNVVQLKDAKVKLFNYGSSCVAVNNHRKDFIVRKLPAEVQFSSVNAIKGADVNGDGSVDLIMAGNEMALLPQFCRIDASYGNMLINDGKGEFNVLSNNKSGLFVKGVVRDIAIIDNRSSVDFLFLQNNDLPVRYSFTRKKRLASLTRQ